MMKLLPNISDLSKWSLFRSPPERRKLSFNEQRELKEITGVIQELEQEKRKLEMKINTKADTLKPEDFRKISKRLSDIEQGLDKNTARWLELEEKREDSIQ